MGIFLSKKMPLCKVTEQMLRPSTITKTLATKHRQLLLTPRLCSKIFQLSDPNVYCREKDVFSLKHFLNSDHNFVPKQDLNSKRPQNFEALISCAVVTNLKNKDKVYLNPDARQHLEAVLIALYRPDRYLPFRRQPLVHHHVLPALESVYVSNTGVKPFVFRWAKRLGSTVWSLLFNPSLEARSLRKKVHGLETKPGQEIAHKLSLFLAVRLWEIVHHGSSGRPRQRCSIRVSERKKLKAALASRCNVYHTCLHTNRTLHVKYDNEIAKALQQTPPKSATRWHQQQRLSPGAHVRRKQIIQVLKVLKHHDKDTIHRFSCQSLALLTSLR